jgi:hypothetical protein
LPFLDHGGRSLALGSAGQLLNEAESLYDAASWDLFREKISAARALSVDPALTTRLDNELAFSNAVTAAMAAETNPAGPNWADAARSWLRANVFFPARLWVLERAAVDWLQADQVNEAARVLGTLQGHHDTPSAQRADPILASLVRFDPSLNAIAQSAAKDVTSPLGPEFEKYVKGPKDRQ